MESHADELKKRILDVIMSLEESEEYKLDDLREFFRKRFNEQPITAGGNDGKQK